MLMEEHAKFLQKVEGASPFNIFTLALQCFNTFGMPRR